MRLARPALEAETTRDVALSGNVVPDPHLRDIRPNIDHCARELVPDGQRGLDPVRGPIVPLPDVQVRAAHARCLDPDEDLVSSYGRHGYLVDDQTGLRPRLANGFHPLGHVLVLARIVC